MSNYRWVILIGIVVIFAYTIGFALQQRNENNMLGAWAIFIVALLSLTIPFFTILRL